MQQFNIELDAPSTPLVLYAMQADSLSRFFQMTITQGGVPWTPPTGAIWTVRFGAPNMPAGWYDTITEVGGSTHPAVVVSDNVAVVEIAEQAVSMVGQNILCVLVTDATGYQIASWQFQLSVTDVPGYDAPEVTTYYNLLTEQVAQVLASQTAAAESATLAQSWAVGNTGTRDGENTNNAQYWSQQAAQSAQEAVGFRTMQGGAVLPIDGDVDLTQPYPTKTGGSLTVTSAANRIDSVTINGFTAQTGSGDASPANVREIENAGRSLKLATFDGSASWGLSSSVTGRIFLYLADAKTDQFGDILCDSYKPTNDVGESQPDYTCYISVSGNFTIKDPRFTDLETAKEILSRVPVTLGYQPIDIADATGIYTGIPVEQSDSYHCDIVELKDRLCNGDTLDTNIQSEFDAKLTSDGSENWQESGYEGSYFLAIPNIDTTVLPQSSYLPSISIEELSSGEIGVSTNPTINLRVRLPGNANPKTYFAEKPITIFYKTLDNKAPKNIKREKHVRKTYTFTGTEDIQKSGLGTNTFYVNFSDIVQNGQAGAVVSNQATALSEEQCIAATTWGVSGSATNQKTMRISSPETTVDAIKAELAAQYAAGVPFMVEYETTAPKVYADAPVEVQNPRGAFTVSGESGTTCQVFMEPLQDGGDADTLNGNTWDDIPVQSVNGKTGAVQLSAQDVGAVSGSMYSTSEVLTGAQWVDGSPIYAQTVATGALPDNAIGTVQLSASNINTIVKIYGFASSGNTTIPLPYYSIDGDTYGVQVSVASNAVSIKTGGDRSSYSGYITVEYTKTGG